MLQPKISSPPNASLRLGTVRAATDIGLATIAFVSHDRIIEATALLILALARAIDAYMRSRDSRTQREDRHVARDRRARLTRQNNTPSKRP